MHADRYLKAVFTVIAFALVAIATKLWIPTIGDPTLGELYALAAIPDQSARQEKARELFARVPLAVVRVQGTVDTEVSNQVDVRQVEPGRGLPGLPGLPNPQ